MRTVDDALGALIALGAPPRLIRHHGLVAEAARELIDGLPERFRGAVDADRVVVGAALHDAGKIRHPGEMDGPGSDHESAGEAMLREYGVPDALARCCVTHAQWADPRMELEDWLVALADKLWKGKRVVEVEEAVVGGFAQRLGLDYWDVDASLTGLLDEVASRGDARLARS